MKRFEGKSGERRPESVPGAAAITWIRTCGISRPGGGAENGMSLPTYSGVESQSALSSAAPTYRRHLSWAATLCRCYTHPLH